MNVGPRASRSEYGRKKSRAPTVPGGLRSPKCPQCGSRVRRVHRHLKDRLPSFIRAIRRYQCRNLECAWEGTLSSGFNRRSLAVLRYAVLAVTAVALGTCASRVALNHLTEDPPGAEFE